MWLSNQQSSRPVSLEQLIILIPWISVLTPFQTFIFYMLFLTFLLLNWSLMYFQLDPNLQPVFTTDYYSYCILRIIWVYRNNLL
ncbi:hypothetical protein B0J11DRAFT_520047 [Dendryphion nanum]|uniref:Uncharacterized protein n=1 Tax=Dendryphion nanum TaxID=256645 RepID=A0A9P9IZJ9_9PLEO|nr:hypothetical protein B0J11DRAFT_520047 [Dendryphion nanum]